MKEITSSEFDSEVIGSSVPVLIDFYTEGCSPCRTMSPVLAELEQESSASLKLVKVDAVADAQFSASFGVIAVPTFVLFNHGKQVGQIIGARSKKELRKWLDDCIRTTP